MDWATLIQIATVVVAIAGIILTWRNVRLVDNTLQEMKNQRKASQRPDLLIPKLPVYGYAYGEEDMWEGEAPVKFYNVGFGVAKNIELTWDVDYSKTIQQIKDYCYQNSIPIVIQVSEDRRRLTIVERGVTTADKLPLFPMPGNFDFLMPVSITNQGLSSYIPLAVRELISTIVYLKIYARRQDPNSKLEFDIPGMILELNYDDLEDSNYLKLFEVICTIRYFFHRPFTTSETEVRQVWGGSFEFKSVK